MSGYTLETLERLRKKLLDLTGRNNLISFKHNPTSVKQIRIIDEALVNLYEKLVKESESFKFKAIPLPEVEFKDETTENFLKKFEDLSRFDEEHLKAIEDLGSDPSEKQLLRLDLKLKDKVREILELPKVTRKINISIEDQAKKNFINPNYELIESSEHEKHNDNFIQTLLYPDILKRKLKKIYDENNNNLSETGISNLFCALGFVEWYESESSDKKILSPLVLIPIKIDRTLIKGEHEYKISFIEDVISNDSLIERFKNDFNISFPELNEETNLVDYIRSCEELISNFPSWKLRKFSTIGFFSFSKYLIYKDLKPEILQSLDLNNSLVHKIINGEQIHSYSEYAEDYNLDQLEKDKKELPNLLTDADSSQSCALIDVLDGKNLVIEGPPGTGKSQTITNIIAACLAQNKKVLFIAEKNAALQVVKNRLDVLGIGDFCFELHSNKAQKSVVYEQLKKTLKIRSEKHTSPHHHDQRKQLQLIKQELNQYASSLNKINPVFKITYQELIWKKIKHEQSTNEDLLRKLRKINWKTKSHDLIEEIGNIERFQNRFIDYHYKDLSKNIWSNINTDEVTISNSGDLVYDAKDIKNKIESIINEPLHQTLGSLTKEELYAICELFTSFPKIGDLNYSLIEKISTDKDFAKTAHDQIRTLSEIDQYELQFKGYKVESIPQTIFDLNELDILNNDFQNVPLEELINYRTQLKINLKEVENITQDLKHIIDLEKVPRDELRTLKSMFEAILNLKSEERTISKTFLDKNKIEECRQFSLKYKKLNAAKRDCEFHFNPTAFDFPVSLVYRWRNYLKNSSFFSFLDPEYRATRLQLSQALKDKYSINNAIIALERLQEYHSYLLEINSDHLLQSIKSTGWPIENEMDIEQFIHRHNAAKEIYDYTVTMLGENNPAMFNLNLDNIKHIIVRIDQLEKHYNHLRVHSLQNFINRSNSITEEVNKVETRILIDFQELSSLKLLDVQNLNNILTNYYSTINNHATIINSYPILGSTKKEDILKHLNFSSLISEIKLGNFHRLNWQNLLKTNPSNLKNYYLLYCEIENRISNFKKYFAPSEFFNHLAYNNTLNHISDLIEASDLLSPTLEFKIFTKNYNSELLEFIYQASEMGISNSELKFSYEYTIMNQEINELAKNHPNISMNNGDVINSLRKKYSLIDKELMQTSRSELRDKLKNTPITQGITNGRPSEFTEYGFIRHQLTLKRQAPIRSLFRKSKNAIQDIMPCFLMSPLTLAQYLPVNDYKFDVLIMDEASQLRPEDAIGSLLRAKQVVIVGDPKQLPPSRFFDSDSTNPDGNDGDSDDVDHESILDLAIKAFSPVRMLKWHYRSKHEHLITFSNQKFYDGELIIFPSPKSNDELLGVESIKVQDGIFENNINIPEAIALLDWLQDFIKKHPDKSIGIVTMNKKQQEFISDLYEQRIKNDPFLENYTRNMENNIDKVIIKNLENIQGDERDVILISTVYGKKNGELKPKQIFGEINKNSGHRRLNVLFTRARYKNIIFTSLDPEDIVPTPSSKIGVHIFKDYLTFAKTKIVPNLQYGDGQPDSDFEFFVMNALKDKYTVISQVGVSGYLIDIGVIDPENPGKFLCGIECDGATYHTAKWVRDRDKIRQENLESLGWNIYRIWSTDWFSNKERETKKLIEYLESLKKK